MSVSKFQNSWRRCRAAFCSAVALTILMFGNSAVVAQQDALWDNFQGVQNVAQSAAGSGSANLATQSVRDFGSQSVRDFGSQAVQDFGSQLNLTLPQNFMSLRLPMHISNRQQWQLRAGLKAAEAVLVCIVRGFAEPAIGKAPDRELTLDFLVGPPSMTIGCE